VQVPVLAKADSMTVDELRDFRRSVRQALEEVCPSIT
jgi:septin family protein